MNSGFRLRSGACLIWGFPVFVEWRKRQEIYSTKAKGDQAMAEKAAEYPEPRFYTREFKLEAVRLSETSGKRWPKLPGNWAFPTECSTGGAGSCGRNRRRRSRQGAPKRTGRRESPLAPGTGAGPAGARHPKKACCLPVGLGRDENGYTGRSQLAVLALIVILALIKFLLPRPFWKSKS